MTRFSLSEINSCNSTDLHPHSFLTLLPRPLLSLVFALCSEQLNRVYQQRHAELNRLLARTQREGVKRLRKLSRERRDVEGNIQRRNIVREYADPASATFAPVARHGGNTRERQGDRYRVESRHINTFEGLSELEASLPPTVTIPTVRQAQSQRRTLVRVAGEAKGAFFLSLFTSWGVYSAVRIFFYPLALKTICLLRAGWHPCCFSTPYARQASRV